MPSEITILDQKYTINISPHTTVKNLVHVDSKQINIFTKIHEKTFVEQILIAHIKKVFRQYAYVVLTQACESLETSFNKLNLKDTKSRWGSCSSKGNINLSWRLALCPAKVANYVIYHEAAHLVQMNHSKKFWDLVEKLDPEYIQNSKWLKTNGAEIFRVLN